MKDRLSTHPGRVQLTPVSGNIYDMTMVDEPTEAGTPLNKATLLSDTAAAAVWPVAADRPSDPVPSDAFARLGANRTQVLADYTTVGTTARREAEIITIVEPIENFKELSVWAYQTASDTPQELYIDVGNAASVESYQHQNPAKRIAHLAFARAGSMSNTYADRNDTLFVKNDETGHVGCIARGAGSPVVSEDATKLTGTSLQLFVSTLSTTARVPAGARIIIIGYAY